ncbi:MAG: hypothetical protein AAFZ65_12705 [Planctomycetota bacterium]
MPDETQSLRLHPSVACALVGLAGLAAAPFLPIEAAAIDFLVAVVALLVAVGLGVSAVAFRRNSGAGAGAGLALGSIGLFVTAVFFAATPVDLMGANAVQATDQTTETR